MLKELMMKASNKYPFGADDVFQQIIGSTILTAPFLFTEEVWTIAQNTTFLQSGILVAISLFLGHGVLYVARRERDWDEERKLMGVTFRYISLMTISFGGIFVMISLTGILQTFEATITQTLKAISILSIFAVLGASTADNLI